MVGELKDIIRRYVEGDDSALDALPSEIKEAIEAVVAVIKLKQSRDATQYIGYR